MDKVELCGQVLTSFRTLCFDGRQPSTFDAFCRDKGFDPRVVRQVIKENFPDMEIPSGRNRMGQIYSRIYNEFKDLCSAGSQPGSFGSFCRSHGVSYKRMQWYLEGRHLRVEGLPGYRRPHRGPDLGGGRRHACQEVPFENVIFEEAGFLPAEGGNAITVRVDGHVAVSFPADTDVAIIARFVRKMGKEAGHVGS